MVVVPAVPAPPAQPAAAAPTDPAAGEAGAVAAAPVPPLAATAGAETRAAPPRSDAPPKLRKPPSKPADSAAPVVTAPAPAKGSVLIAISPWGQVEVNGAPAGTAPPLTRLELPAGQHTITVRNADFPPHTQRVTVDAERPVTVKHRFGS